jgi:diguanylate cyclase (GGDEF)-like protein
MVGAVAGGKAAGAAAAWWDHAEYLYMRASGYCVWGTCPSYGCSAWTRGFTRDGPADARRTELALATEGQLSEVLSEFARTMVTDFPIQGILERLVQRIVEILPITAAGVTLITPDTNPRYLAASDAAALRYEELQTELGEGPCLAVYRTGEAVAVSDIRTDDRFRLFGPRAAQAGLVAVFTFPLRQGDRQLGALDLYRDTPGLLDETDMATAQTLADVTAAYLVNAETRSDLQDASDRSREAALHDALTGLPNRVLLLELLEHALARQHRTGKMATVLLADLDQFKMVNDVHGHRAGDELLIAVAARLTALLRPGDTVARMSGDEFVVMCEDLDDESQADVIGMRLVEALADPFELTDAVVEVTASVGIAFTGRGVDIPERLLQDADVAMYQAKRKGGDHHQVLDLREQQVASDRSSLGRDLRGAAGRGELRAEYQPIVQTTDGRITGVEALLRWDHPTRGVITPLTVIPLAEQSGLITEIGRWVLEQACVDRHRWAGLHNEEELGMSVNVSVHQLMGSHFVDTVADILTATATNSRYLTLEITESAFVQDGERATIVLGALKQLGVLIALDDFGTGYSSLSYLKRFPVDIVKIDQGFIADLAQDQASHDIVSAIIDLAHRRHMTVITEGVETAEQHRVVETLGSESCQGFYFARPMSADHLDTITGGTQLVDLCLPVPLLATGGDMVDR